MVWKTAGLASANTEWWRYRHDEWNTGRYGVDARPPGILRAPALDVATRTLTFTAPGDDWYAGQVTKYRISTRTASIEIAATQAAGQTQSLVIPAGIDRATVQAVDDAGNLGRALDVDLTTGVVGGGQPLFGKKLSLRDTNPDPARRQLMWLAKDASLTIPTTAADRPTAVGATITIRNPTSGESTTMTMPAAGWTQLSNGDFRYRDRRRALGPVKTALLKRGRLAKVIAKGGGVGLTLNEPSQGSLGVTLASGSRRWCTVFGGTIVKDQAGRFVAKNAPPPAACP